METKTITLPKTADTVLQYSLTVVSFLIPFLITGPQLLTGTIVNALLFLFVSQVSPKKTLPIIVLPSIGALLNGVLFGKFTVFLFYFLPFIWMGNYILTISFRYVSKKSSFAASVVASSLLKFAFLFTLSFLFVTMKFVPPLFLQSMGLIQVYTALLGGLVALFVTNIISKRS